MPPSAAATSISLPVLPDLSLIVQRIKDPSLRARLVGLSRDDAQCIADFLSALLHEGTVSPEDKRYLLTLLLKLMKSAQVLPQSYKLQGVQCDFSQAREGGAFADIYQGEYQGQRICVKAVRIFQRGENVRILRAFAKEIVLWAHLSHENILPFYGIYQGVSGRICIISPWIDEGDLSVYLQNFPQRPRFPLALDITAGLRYLHQSNIVHGDLKAKNILVSDSGRALIADFGISCIMVSIKLATTQVSTGTMRWMAPELFTGDAEGNSLLTLQSDVWSLGCVYYEVFTRKFPFYHYTSDARLSFVRHGDSKATPLRPLTTGDDVDNISDAMWDLMNKCWNYEPCSRPSCDNVYEHITSLTKVCEKRDSPHVSSWKTIRGGPEIGAISEHAQHILFQADHFPHSPISPGSIQSEAITSVHTNSVYPQWGEVAQNHLPSAQQLSSPFTGQMNPANMPNKPGNFSLNTYIGASPAATAAMHQRTLSIIGFPPPLEKVKFNLTLPGFLHKRGIKIDPSLLRLNDQRIDLANLHALVISEGGYNKVHENGLWDVIGGRMGFVNFPGSDHEPAKSGPVVAQNLVHVYREYLLDLESAYIRTWISNAHMRMGNPGMQHGGGPGGLPNGMGITANGQPPSFNPQLLQYANMSAAELRQRHVPENVITMVDQLRPQLQRTIMEQKRFQQQVRMNARNGPGMAGMPVDANGMQPQNQGTVMNDAGQPNGSAAMMLRQQMMKHPMMNGAGGMDARFDPFHAQYPLRNLEMTKNAVQTINRMKEDYKKGPHLARLMQANIEIPYDQQAEFNRLLDATYRQAQELDQKLHLLHVILPSGTQRAIAVYSIIATQRQLKMTSQPRYILSLDLLRNLATELHKIVEMFTAEHMQKLYARMQQPGQQHPLAQLGQVPNQPPQPPGMSNHPGPHPHPQPPQSVQNNMNGTAHSPPGSNMLNHYATQSSPTTSTACSSTTTTTYANTSSTGFASFPTTSGSIPPHMPSSRGASINLQAPPPERKVQNPPAPSNTAPSPAAAVSTPAPANAPKSPKPKPKPKQTTGKRKMSTAPNAPAAVADQPSPPKRPIMKWEGPQSEELQQKGQIENIRMEEDDDDTRQFLEEFIKMVGRDPAGYQ